MTPTSSVFVHYTVFRRKENRLPLGERFTQACTEWEQILAAAQPEVQVRGIYSTVGFRADSDLMLWTISKSPDALQRLTVRLRASELGQGLDMSWAFMGVHRPAEFAPDHIPAFIKGTPPARYISVYPFVRREEWYLLPPAERGRLLREHGALGKDFGDVLTNTTQAFGLGDFEWLLAFESDRLERIVDMIRHLRAAEARRYTKVEIPFITGIRKPLTEVVADLA
ncbi:MAG: chlorite dismutase family protein [Firmicutes bacterium]|nr:chlorite dismutase family protein [Bacillota bacterium]